MMIFIIIMIASLRYRVVSNANYFQVLCFVVSFIIMLLYLVIYLYTCNYVIFHFRIL